MASRLSRCPPLNQNIGTFSTEQIFLLFIGVSTGLAILGRLVLRRLGRAHHKRRAWALFNVASSLVFVGFTWAMGFPALAVVLALISCAVIAIYNWKMVWFCDECGGLALDRLFHPRPETCPRCGARQPGAS
jgi:hypothetical protein